MPQAPGHVLIVPKKPSRNLLDADPAVLGPLMAVTKRMALAVRKAFDADGVQMMQFNEAPAGQSVFHLHFHVIPRHAGRGAEEAIPGEMEKPEVLAENAQKISSALSSLWRGT